MFSRRDRVSREVFPTALKTGRRLVSRHFTVVLPKGEVGYAVVVSKKVAKLSVERHTLKRRAVAALKGIQDLPKGAIVFPKASACALSVQAIRAELSELLSKI